MKLLKKSEATKFYMQNGKITSVEINNSHKLNADNIYVMQIHQMCTIN